MDSKNNYKAEDFLSDRVPKGKEDLISDSERELAEDIKAAVSSAGQEKLSPLEVIQLWQKIQDGKKGDARSFNWGLYLQIAAVLFIALTIGLWQYNRSTPTQKLLDFAAQNVNKKVISKEAVSPLKDDQNSNGISAKNEEENIITTNDFNTLVVGDAQRSVIKLPDGTKVWLNSGSKLIYPIAFSKGSREVYLEGEAYFDVTHDKNHPFYVHAKNMDIKVLGTEFYISSNVQHKNNYAVLVTGSIAFSSGSWLNKTERKLVPGEQINLDPEENKLVVSKVRTEEFESWRDGYLNVNSEPLDVIIQRVARYYNIEISTEGLNLSEEKFSGRLDFQRSADDVLDILCLGSHYVYNGTERRLELKKN